ncbi:MAG: hypothetical protein AAB495_03470 [Patescibacteria group bacterium]
MKPEQILNVIEKYRDYFFATGIKAIDYSHDRIVDNPTRALEHCYGMLDQMVEFVRQGKLEKVFRWLGFLQGVLWSNGIYTLAALKDHNQSKKMNTRKAICR